MRILRVVTTLVFLAFVAHPPVRFLVFLPRTFLVFGLCMAGVTLFFAAVRVLLRDPLPTRYHPGNEFLALGLILFGLGGSRIWAISMIAGSLLLQVASFWRDKRDQPS